MKDRDLLISVAAGAVLGLVAFAAMLKWEKSILAIVAAVFGSLVALVLALLQAGAGIRHLRTGMERDRVEIARATEELSRLLSRIQQPTDLQIEMFGRGETMVPRFDVVEKRRRVKKGE